MQRACAQCGGQGNIAQTKTERKVLEVHIEKGMADGAKVQFKGMADETPGKRNQEMSISLSRKRSTHSLSEKALIYS